MMDADRRVTKDSLKGLVLASSCVFRVDLVILAGSEVYVRYFLELAAAASASDGVWC